MRRRDFRGGRRYFREDVRAFGSLAAVCDGLDDLVAQQWRRIWPNISGFGFDVARLRVHESADGLLVCAEVPWRSTGRAEVGTFRRCGRATIVLTREHLRASWRAAHSHYSLDPGVAQTVVPPARPRR